MPLRQFLERLAATPAGRIVLINALDGMQASTPHVSATIVGEILTLAANEAATRSGMTDSEYPKIVWRILYSSRGHYFSRPQPLDVGSVPLLRSIQSVAKLCNDDASAIVDRGVFSALGVIADEIDHPLGSQHEHLELVAEIIRSGGHFRSPTAGLGQQFDIFWATPDEVPPMDGETPATCARDYLGLVHYNNSVSDRNGLLEVVFSLPNPNSQRMSAPTFIEAADHRRFAAAPCNPSTAGWGQAADLHKLDDSLAEFDGGREAVLTKVEVGNIKNCVALGYPLRTVRLMDDEFILRLLRGRSIDDVVTSIESLCTPTTSDGSP